MLLVYSNYSYVCIYTYISCFAVFEFECFCWADVFTYLLALAFCLGFRIVSSLTNETTCRSAYAIPLIATHIYLYPQNLFVSNTPTSYINWQLTRNHACM